MFCFNYTQIIFYINYALNILAQKDSFDMFELLGKLRMRIKREAFRLKN